MTECCSYKETVRETYAEIARSRKTPAQEACCAPAGHPPDYTPEEIASVPAGAYLCEGSGNPVRAARLQPGERVVDLGCGAGMDVFLAANQVGPTGRVVGVDMTPEMLDRARANAGNNYPQVEFRRAEIEHLPLHPDATDVVLSNCVINLARDKETVYREIHRVLRPGGRFAVADIVLRGEPGWIQKTVAKMAPASCITTALEENLYLETIRRCGFEGIEVVAERPALSQPLDRFIHAQAVTIVGYKPPRP